MTFQLFVSSGPSPREIGVAGVSVQPILNGQLSEKFEKTVFAWLILLLGSDLLAPLAK